MNIVLIIGNLVADVTPGPAYIYSLGMKDSDGIVWCPHPDASVKCMAKMDM